MRRIMTTPRRARDVPATADVLMLWREVKSGIVKEVSVGRSGVTFKSSGAVRTGPGMLPSTESAIIPDSEETTENNMRT